MMLFMICIAFIFLSDPPILMAAEITNILCLNRFVVETAWHERKEKKDKTLSHTRVLDTACGDEQKKTKQYATRVYSIPLVVMNKKRQNNMPHAGTRYCSGG